MAIEPLQHVTLLAPRHSVDQLTDWLQGLSVLHVEDAAGLVPDESGEEAAELKKAAVSTEEMDTRIHELRRIKEIFSSFGALKGSLVEMIVELQNRVTLEEREETIENFDYRPLYEKACRLEEEYNDHQTAIEAAREEYDALEWFRLFPFEPEEVHSLQRMEVWVGSMLADNWSELRSSEEAQDLLAVTELRRRKRFVDICAVALREDAEEARRLLRSHQFEEVSVPRYEGTRRERMDGLTEEIRRRHRESERCRKGIKELAGEVRKVEVLLGYWEAERARVEAQNKTLSSNRISVLTGFIRERDAGWFREELADEFPSVSDIYRAPTPEDNAPVAIRNSSLLKPLRFLVDMFGRPDYFSFDPTPFLAFSFLIFFGICFGDAVYGLALALTGYLLARKARAYENLHNLCMMFCYAGIFTMVTGVVLGSWAADLPEYLGENNVLMRLQQRLMLVDPIDNAVVLLVISIGIGVVNQFYGIALKGYGLIRRGRVWDAVFDAGLWFLVLPGFLITFGSLFFDFSPAFIRLGFALLAAGGAGLILTQGRDADGIVAKFAAGLVSIYGIMGTYGCVSFLSDILSYSRLIALGLATTVIGVAFNMLAGLVHGVPVVGIVLFVLIIILGHTFNFVVSMLAAFVHPVRLIFLEFFNRFYEPGGPKFTPLSLSTDSIIVES